MLQIDFLNNYYMIKKCSFLLSKQNLFLLNKQFYTATWRYATLASTSVKTILNFFTFQQGKNFQNYHDIFRLDTVKTIYIYLYMYNCL